jgi:hypothetical protein
MSGWHIDDGDRSMERLHRGDILRCFREIGKKKDFHQEEILSRLWHPFDRECLAIVVVTI